MVYHRLWFTGPAISQMPSKLAYSFCPCNSRRVHSITYGRLSCNQYVAQWIMHSSKQYYSLKKTNPSKLTMHCMAGFGTSNIDTNTSTQNLPTTKTFIYNRGSIFLHIMRALGRMSQTCELSGTTTDYFWKYQRDAFFNLHCCCISTPPWDSWLSMWYEFSMLRFHP